MEVFMIQSGTIDASGRVVIPAAIRKEMRLDADRNILFSWKNGELKIVNPTDFIEKIREKAVKLKKPGESVTDEFIKWRKKDSGDL